MDEPVPDPGPDPTPAGLWRRVLAYAVDVLPLIAIAFAVAWFLLGFDQIWRDRVRRPDDPAARQAFIDARNQMRLWTFVAMVVYGAAMEASPMQGTLGKRLMGAKVVGADGRRLRLLHAMFRNLCKLVSYVSLGLGFYWALFDRRRQTWHDRLSQTYVVRRDCAAP